MKEIGLIIAALAIYDALKFILLLLLEDKPIKPKIPTGKQSRFQQRLDEAIKKKNEIHYN